MNTQTHTSYWESFINRLAAKNMQVLEAHTVAREADEVRLRCNVHPQAQVQTWQRKKLTVWMAPNESGEGKRLLSPCPCCAQAEQQEVSSRRYAGKIEASIKVDERLKPFGWRVLNWQGATKRDGNGKPVAIKNTICCIACESTKEIFVAQMLAKWEKSLKEGRTLKQGCGCTS